jgi:hypothetical protein
MSNLAQLPTYPNVAEEDSLEPYLQGDRFHAGKKPGPRKSLGSFILAAAAWFDARPWPSLVLITLCFLSVAVAEGYGRPLLNDEIYTVHIAQQPTLRQMLGVARQVDLHPPLHYLAVREAMRLPAPRWLTARLPSILGGLVLSLSMFWFTARRFGNLFGFVAVGVLWMTPALDYAWSDRPYMLWLGFLWALLLVIDVARRNERPWWSLPAVFCLSLGMVLSHLLGIACIAVILLAEVVRAWRQRKWDWKLSAAVALPSLAGMMLYYQLHELGKNDFPVGQQVSFDLLLQLYELALVHVTPMVLYSLFIVATFFGRRSLLALPGESRLRARGGRAPEDGVLLGTFVLSPLLLFIPASLLHLQFWLRYGAAAMPAMGAVIAWALARRLYFGRAIAFVLVFVSVGFMITRIVEVPPLSNAGMVEGGRRPIPLESLDPSLPIVSASPMTFVEMADRESPSIAHRVYYLTDRNEAYEYAHYTLFENEEKIVRLLNLPVHAEPLPAFLQQHARFYMVGNYTVPQIWLPRALADHGWKLDYLGKFVSSYESDDLYLVTR